MTKKEKMAKDFFNQKVEELQLQGIEFIINRGQIHFEGSKAPSAAYNFSLMALMVDQWTFWLYEIESIYDMILHELAHAIAGRKAGHGNEFRKVCKQIGCKGMYKINEY